jgi:hypothetical protein
MIYRYVDFNLLTLFGPDVKSKIPVAALNGKKVHINMRGF